MIAVIAVPLVLGSLRYARAWEIHAPDGVEIVVDGHAAGSGVARGVTWGRALGTDTGWHNWSVSRSLALRGPEITCRAIDDRLGDPADDEGLPFTCADVFGDGVSVQLQRDGEPVRAKAVNVYLAVRSFRVMLELRVEVDDQG
ncbi:MAG: hypothetical protein KDE27_27410 [Planctomycetes bacterium]|nr:hypothetical protein [Planctomycetota bacterium]